MTIQRFPGWRWGPGHPDGHIFESEEDVPKGYVDDPNLLAKAKSVEYSQGTFCGMERAEIVARLKAANIKFFAGAGLEKLGELALQHGVLD